MPEHKPGKPAGRRAAAKRQASDLPPVAELASFMVFANRINARLQQIAETSNIGVSVSDWLLLRSLDREETPSMPKIALQMGVTRQRVHQQVQTLQQAELLNPAKKGEGPRKGLSLTPKGRATLAKADKLFGDTLAMDGDGAEKRVHAARRVAGRILRSLAPQAKQAA